MLAGGVIESRTGNHAARLATTGPGEPVAQTITYVTTTKTVSVP